VRVNESGMRGLSLFTRVLAPLPLRNSRVGRNVLVSSLSARTDKRVTTCELYAHAANRALARAIELHARRGDWKYGPSEAITV